ncbi:MAG TPA: hypothetical protein VI818_01930 [Candidatus Thermoplasmatota archaeon]|nr:hypothetical protein [Candidatus Thermoplasmatota archaeon]
MPPATAQTAAGSWTFDVASPGLLVVSVDAKLEGEAASALRSWMDNPDLGADGDGTVTAEEVNDFTYKALALLNGPAAEMVSGASFLIDAKGPEKIQFKVLEFKDAPGDVDSTNPIALRALADVTFPVKAGSRHTLTVEPSTAGEGMLNTAVEKAVLKAPRNYVIESTKGLPSAATLSADKTQIAFAGSFQTADEMTVTFLRTGGTSPSTAFLGVVLAAVIGVAATRRRPLD